LIRVVTNLVSRLFNNCYLSSKILVLNIFFGLHHSKIFLSYPRSLDISLFNPLLLRFFIHIIDWNSLLLIIFFEGENRHINWLLFLNHLSGLFLQPSENSFLIEFVFDIPYATCTPTIFPWLGNPSHSTFSIMKSMISRSFDRSLDSNISNFLQVFFNFDNKCIISILNLSPWLKRMVRSHFLFFLSFGIFLGYNSESLFFLILNRKYIKMIFHELCNDGFY